MIDLSYPRSRMLADIRAAGAVAAAAPSACADLATKAHARCVLRRRTPAEILPDLDATLARRFCDVDPERLHRDLLSPLKKAVGNAYKRGNRLDPAKWITVEVVATEAGAFLEVADEGAGFDVAATLAAFQGGRAYFAHHGSGFRRFAKARSIVSFDARGSRFRLRFLRAAALPQARAGTDASEPGLPGA